MTGRMRLPLLAGPPPGKGRNGNKGKPSVRSMRLLRDMFGPGATVGAWERIGRRPALETLRRWYRLGYIAPHPHAAFFTLTAKGKERAR